MKHPCEKEVVEGGKIGIGICLFLRLEVNRIGGGGGTAICGLYRYVPL